MLPVHPHFCALSQSTSTLVINSYLVLSARVALMPAPIAHILAAQTCMPSSTLLPLTSEKSILEAAASCLASSSPPNMKLSMPSSPNYCYALHLLPVLLLNIILRSPVRHHPFFCAPLLSPALFLCCKALGAGTIFLFCLIL